MNKEHESQNKTDSPRPLVSISCITYNHGPYIAQAIDSFLMQKTNFPIEILVHDDASTDNTANIIREYEAKYPEIIKPIYETENQWSKGRRGSAVFNFPRARGKYIALCEGDDYWTEPYKLQKQVDFMEANEDYSLCFTNSKMIDENGEFIKHKISEKQNEETYSYYSQGILAPTQTMLFRKKYVNTIPKSFKSAPGGDTYLVVWLSKHGKVKYHNYNSAVYRITNQGVWTGKNDFQKEWHSFRTYYAILDIVENEVRSKFILLLFKTLANMRRKAVTDSENIISRESYNEMYDYFKKERKLNKINIFEYYGFRLFLLFYYFVLSFLKKFKDVVLRVVILIMVLGI